MPEPHELGRNGSFAVFKMIRTDVVGFENLLQSNKDRIDPELLAAKMCGRWRNGVPLALAPDTDSPPGGIAPDQLNNFEYVNPDGSGDPKGLRVRRGPHSPNQSARPADHRPGRARRQQQYAPAHSPRLALRPHYDPAQPYDGIERGLLGYFINSHIENQYEFVSASGSTPAISPGPSG